MKGISIQFSSDGGSKKLLFLEQKTLDVIQSLPIIKATAEHRNFILGTWEKSYEPQNRKTLYGGMRQPTPVFRESENRIAEYEYNAGNCWVVTSEDLYTVHAWVAGKPGYLYHVYVPPKLRGNGIGAGLVELICGTEYATHKPWPNQVVPRRHTAHYKPYWPGNEKNKPVSSLLPQPLHNGNEGLASSGDIEE